MAEHPEEGQGWKVRSETAEQRLSILRRGRGRKVRSETAEWRRANLGACARRGWLSVRVLCSPRKLWGRGVKRSDLGFGFCVEKKLPWGRKDTAGRAERETSRDRAIIWAKIVGVRW